MQVQKQNRIHGSVFVREVILLLSIICAIILLTMTALQYDALTEVVSDYDPEERVGCARQSVDCLFEAERDHGVYTFMDMFRESLGRADEPPCSASVEMFGEILWEYSEYCWPDSEPGDLRNPERCDNAMDLGCLELKRYFAVMANRELRKKYFGF